MKVVSGSAGMEGRALDNPEELAHYDDRVEARDCSVA